ncbi:hypothetical protein VTI74DRAFT_11127 [Chaetomium olivicolor]
MDVIKLYFVPHKWHMWVLRQVRATAKDANIKPFPAIRIASVSHKVPQDHRERCNSDIDLHRSCRGPPAGQPREPHNLSPSKNDLARVPAYFFLAYLELLPELKTVKLTLNSSTYAKVLEVAKGLPLNPRLLHTQPRRLASPWPGDDDARPARLCSSAHVL